MAQQPEQLTRELGPLPRSRSSRMRSTSSARDSAREAAPDRRRHRTIDAVDIEHRNAEPFLGSVPCRHALAMLGGLAADRGLVEGGDRVDLV